MALETHVMHASRAARDWQRTARLSARLILLWAVLALLLADMSLTRWFFLSQDRLVIVALALFLYGTSYSAVMERGTAAPRRSASGGNPLLWAMIAAAAILAAGAAGRLWIMQGHALSRDEQMVLFDAAIFAQGEWLAPLAPPWRGLIDALNSTFLLRVPDNSVWASAYLPGNALGHMIFARAGLGGLFPPVMVAIGLVSILWCVQLLWPQRRDLFAPAVLLGLLSAQIMATAMTPYAMSAHFGCAALWLALYLRDRWWSHAGAILVGFVATGLHQLVFHPLYAAPMLALLLWQRRWLLAAIYAAAYAAIILFWAGWFAALLAGFPDGGQLGQSQGVAGFVRVAAGLISEFGLAKIGLMAANILRLFSWNHLLLLPLVTLGCWIAWERRDARLLAMLGSIKLTALAMLLILAYQGHGWGYRYLHAHLPMMILLALGGWAAISDSGLAGWRRIWQAGCAASLLLMAVQLWQARAMVLPYAAAAQAIDAVDAPLLIIDDRAIPFGDDLVINRADLSNRPIRLALSALKPAQLQALCAQGPIPLFADAAHMRAINALFGQAHDPAAAQKRASRWQAAGCAAASGGRAGSLAQ